MKYALLLTALFPFMAFAEPVYLSCVRDSDSSSTFTVTADEQAATATFTNSDGSTFTADPVFTMTTLTLTRKACTRQCITREIIIDRTTLDYTNNIYVSDPALRVTLSPVTSSGKCEIQKPPADRAF